MVIFSCFIDDLMVTVTVQYDGIRRQSDWEIFSCARDDGQSAQIADNPHVQRTSEPGEPASRGSSNPGCCEWRQTGDSGEGRADGVELSRHYRTFAGQSVGVVRFIRLFVGHLALPVDRTVAHES